MLRWYSSSAFIPQLYPLH